eukprot:CAMPEP_0171125414 /NCGR_PEP_ID=MMETSP0766_2-20121228/111199_1 /TAXON_ID=439317 /ORGANISM="Gambierdiscus australes, Strain CAWD 149" /LENGTH=34 /DNA_ID= /DNA_START= /DNA_END= /DNA_ORIENTATION=
MWLYLALALAVHLTSAKGGVPTGAAAAACGVCLR